MGQVDSTNGSDSTSQTMNVNDTKASATLRLTANTNQILVGSPNITTLNIDASLNRTITIPSTSGSNANVVLSESAQTVNGVKTFSATAVFLAGLSLASLTLSALSNQLTLGSGNQIILHAPTPTASRTYSLPDVGSNANFVLSEGAQTLNGTKTFSAMPVFLAGLSITSLTLSATSNQLIMGTGNTIILNASTPTSSHTYSLPDVLSNADFIMNQGAQTVNGIKTFSATTVCLSGLSLASSSNQLIIGSGNTITLNVAPPANSVVYTLPDAGIDTNFVMSESNQTINGLKTFSSALRSTLTSNQIVLGTGNTVTIATLTPSSNRVYALDDLGVDASFIMNNGTQPIDGLKSFIQQVKITPTSNQLVFGTGNTFTLDAPTPASSRTYTIRDVGSNADFLMTEGGQSINGNKIFLGSLTFGQQMKITSTSSQIVLGTPRTITLDAPVPASSHVYTLRDIGANADFVMTEGSQSINGAKTFTSLVTFSGAGFTASASNANALTLTNATNQLVFGSGNTTTITCPTPAASRTYTFPDAGANAQVVMTEGAQIISGPKTISFPTVGGTPTPLNFYQELATTLDFTSTSFNGIVTRNVHFTRIGNVVTMTLEGFFGIANGAAGQISGTAIPAQFRPYTFMQLGGITVADNTDGFIGMLTVNTNGQNQISRGTFVNNGLRVPSNFTGVSNIGFQTFTVSWHAT